MTHASPDSRSPRPLRRIPLDQPQGPRLSRCARAARQGRRGGARRGDDAAVGLSAQAPHPLGRRRLGAGAGDRAGAAARGAAGGGDPPYARRHFAAARRRFGRGKVTVLAAKATRSGSKVTLSLCKVTVSAVFAFVHCHRRHNRDAGSFEMPSDFAFGLLRTNGRREHPLPFVLRSEAPSPPPAAALRMNCRKAAGRVSRRMPLAPHAAFRKSASQ